MSRIEDDYDDETAAKCASASFKLVLDSLYLVRESLCLYHVQSVANTSNAYKIQLAKQLTDSIELSVYHKTIFVPLKLLNNIHANHK